MTNEFDLSNGKAILERTPGVLRAWLEGLPAAWTEVNEGAETWSAVDILGHLIHGERTDWIPRAEHILAGKGDVPFEPFDRFAQFNRKQRGTVGDLLDEFEELRKENLGQLLAMELTSRELKLPGTHPALGSVTLDQLLATWVVHDLSHLAQIARVMAHQWTDTVGPWRAYLRVLNPGPGET